MNDIFEKRGFTLIELLLYVGLSAMVLLSLSIFISTLLQSRVKNQAILEVEGQGRQVMEIIVQEIRGAQNINSPARGDNSSALSLDVVDALSNPTIFSLSGGAIKIQKGAGSAIDLTSSFVTASNLSFFNLSKLDTPGIIEIEFTLSYINPENRQEYDYVKSFYGSASLR